MMRVHTDIAALYYAVGFESRNGGGCAVRLREGQPVHWSHGVGIVIGGPILRLAPDVAHFNARILPKLVLDSQVVLQNVRRAAADLLADGRVAKPCAKTANYDAFAILVVDAGWKLIGIVEEPSVVGDRTETGNKGRIYASRAVREENVVAVIKLAEPRPDCPLTRSRRIPGYSQPRRESSVVVVLDGTIRPGQAASSRWAGV